MRKLVTGCLALVISVSAWAMDLTEAKTNGYLGEQRNGYLGLVKPNPEAETIMQQVNAKRLAAFTNIAKQNGISADDVATLAAEKAIQAAASGTYIQGSNGQWLKKQ
ncbi:YdbL family protein [Shewanella sp. NIFS-20-20]|uniref:YdbL family protein n=1 Tax=Shewanella sp. NIFS-20-20 TaxID=2853806 RepID=UPI00210D2775|nr:YdbL family protein [Shewanella sp. NIFS-20-20]